MGICVCIASVPGVFVCVSVCVSVSESGCLKDVRICIHAVGIKRQTNIYIYDTILHTATHIRDPARSHRTPSESS